MSTYIIKNETADQAEYLNEMLELWGGAFAQIVGGSEIRQLKNAEVILIPPSVALEPSTVSVLTAVSKHVILIAPAQDLLDRLEIESSLSYADNKQVSWLRLSTPLLGGYSHYSLPVVGRRVQAGAKALLPSETNILAYLYETGPEVTDRPVIWSTMVRGACVTVVGFDLIECFRNLRQGFLSFADWRPSADMHARPCDLFGPDWENQCPSQHLPLADFYCLLLLALIEQGLERPMVRFWQLPGNSKSLILLSGDEDNADPAYNEEILTFLDSLQATMTIYLLMDGTQTTPKQMQQWQSRGHRFSVHPYPKDNHDTEWTPQGDVLGKIERCFTTYRERYNQPMRTVRNHRLYWTGYDEIPRLWEKLGVEMDCTYGYNYRFRGMSGFFISPAASLPIRFLDRHFKRIGVYQQPCHLGDDTCFNPEGRLSRKMSPELFENYAQTLITQILEPTGTPFAVCFHPVNFVRFARQAEERFMKKAKSLGAKIIADDAWLDFWQMRCSWRLVKQERNESGFAYHLQGDQASKDLSVTFPTTFKQKSIDRITIDGEDCRTELINHFGMKRFLFVVPDGITECQINIKIN